MTHNQFLYIKKALETGFMSADIKSGLVYNRKSVFRNLSAAGYIVGTVMCDEKKQVKAHQAVWVAAGFSVPRGYVLDHINRIRTDNRISNLRLCTYTENIINRTKPKNMTSKYYGVSRTRHDPPKPWRVSIKYPNSKKRKLKYFVSEQEAAKQYDIWIRDIRGNMAPLNFPENK